MSLENSRSKLSEMNERKKELGKVNFVKKRSQELETLTFQKNKNSKIYEKLKSETEKIHKYRSKALKEIEGYR